MSWNRVFLTDLYQINLISCQPRSGTSPSNLESMSSRTELSWQPWLGCDATPKQASPMISLSNTMVKGQEQDFSSRSVGPGLLEGTLSQEQETSTPRNRPKDGEKSQIKFTRREAWYTCRCITQVEPLTPISMVVMKLGLLQLFPFEERRFFSWEAFPTLPPKRWPFRTSKLLSKSLRKV